MSEISMVRILLWGAGGSVAQGRLEQPCNALQLNEKIILLDAGEHCQKMFEVFRLGSNSPLYIFISHLHSDHYNGLNPLLESFSLLGRKRPVYIYGPFGLRRIVMHNLEKLNFPVHVTEFLSEEGTFHLIENILSVRYVSAPHSLNALSYIFETKEKIRLDEEKLNTAKLSPIQRKKLTQDGLVIKDGIPYKLKDFVKQVVPGIKVAYSGDTLPNFRFAAKALDSDVLIHEATLLKSDWYEKPYMAHTSLEDALNLARKIRAKLIVLTHFSSRYRDNDKLEIEARTLFPRVIFAEKGLIINILFKYPRIFHVEQISLLNN